LDRESAAGHPWPCFLLREMGYGGYRSGSRRVAGGQAAGALLTAANASSFVSNTHRR
jgi:hypothetical protein